MQGIFYVTMSIGQDTCDQMSILEMKNLEKHLKKFDAHMEMLTEDDFAKGHTKSTIKETRRLVAVAINLQFEKSKSEPIRLI